MSPPRLTAPAASTHVAPAGGRIRRQRLQGLPWLGSGMTINLEINDPNSLDSLLEIVLVYLCLNPYLLMYTLCVADPLSASGHPYFNPLSLFSHPHSLHHHWCSLAVLPVDSRHILQCARQAQQERLQYGKFRNFHIGLFSFYFGCTNRFHRYCGLTWESEGERGDAVRQWPMQCVMDAADYSFKLSCKNSNTLHEYSYETESCLTRLSHLSGGSTSVLMCCSYDYLQDMNFKPDCSDSDGNPIWNSILGCEICNSLSAS